jgi:CubicO group peptidase (beta-lactamase class C family)
VLAAPGTRRIYSNAGYEQLGLHLTAATGIDFADYLSEAVLDPLGMSATSLRGSPAHGLTSSVADLIQFAAELLAPRLVAPDTWRTMVEVAFPGLRGVLPGHGRLDPLDWGLGPERNFARPGHWGGSRVSTSTFGHFGGTGTFCWVDPAAHLACVCLTDTQFGPWARTAWPALNDAIVAEWAGV